MKLGHYILIAVGLFFLYWLFTSSNKPAVAYTGGGTWYDRLLAGAGLGLGTYVRSAGPYAFGGPSYASGSTTNRVATSNVSWGSSGYGYENSPYADRSQSGGGTAGLQAYMNDVNIGRDATAAELAATSPYELGG